MGKFFLITDPIENEKWKMTGETKKIGQPLLYLYDDGTVDKKIIIE